LSYGRHLVDEDDVAAVAVVLRGDRLTGGPAVDAFEAALARATGAVHAVACSSGTAALHLAAMALGLGPGDAVVVPTVTFLATANAVRFVGADVIFADVDSKTGLMGPAHLEAALAGRANAKAVLPVHLAGQSPDTAAIGGIARQRGLAVVEDACHALGTTIGDGGERAGDCRHGDMAVFSFHPVKAVAMGEGGAVTTNDPVLRDRLRMMRNHGMTRIAGDFLNKELAFDAAGEANPWYYEMAEAGFNYRASDIHCALGLSQLRKLARFVERRRTLAARYDELMKPLAPVLRPLGRVTGCRPAWHLYVVLIDFDKAGISRAKLMRALHAKGIGTQVHYIPIHAQPYYQRLYGARELPGAATYYRRCLTLPLHAGMDDTDVERVTAALAEALKTG